MMGRYRKPLLQQDEGVENVSRAKWATHPLVKEEQRGAQGLQWVAMGGRVPDTKSLPQCKSSSQTILRSY